MNGDIPVQFLGEGVTVTSPPYPTPGWATAQVYPEILANLTNPPLPEWHEDNARLCC